MISRRSPTLILASSSKYRALLLKRAGYKFKVVHPGVEETVENYRSPRTAVVSIAMKKLEACCRLNSEGVVIAADQLVDFEGKVLNKPATQDEAIDLLMKLRGRWHKLLTAIAVKNCETGEIIKYVDIHNVKLRMFNRNEAINYVFLDHPEGCCGAIKIESMGTLLIEDIRGKDYTAVIGLPMIKLSAILRRFNINPLNDIKVRRSGRNYLTDLR